MTPRAWQWAGLVIGVAAFGLLLLDERTQGPVYSADQGVYDRIGAWNDAGTPVNAFGEALTLIVSVPYAIGITLVTVVVFWVLHERRLAIWGGVAGVAASGIIWGPKQLIHRALPPKASGYQGGYSFPSGHTIAAVASVGLLILLAAQVYIDRKKPAPDEAAKVWHWAVAAWVIFALVMGVGRIITQHHWASDVYASWAMGLALACIVLLLAHVPCGVPGAPERPPKPEARITDRVMHDAD